MKAAAAIGGAGVRGRSRATVWRGWAWVFLAPYVAVTLGFFLYPLAHAVRLAFYQTNGPRARVWVGFDNFRFALGDPDFWRAVVNTVVFTGVSLLVQLPLALGLAVLLDNRAGNSPLAARARSVLRLAIFAPNLVGQVFVGILFGVLLAPRYGLINRAIAGLTGHGLDTRWLEEPGLVMPAIVLASLWLYVGFNMVYFLAALQGVDRSLVEAADIDGASRWGVFWHVTLPAIRPVATFVVVTSTIGSLQLFELPYTLLRGYGPNNAGMTIVGYLYSRGFEQGDLGAGAAIGWVLTIMILAASLAQLRLARDA